MPLLRLVVAPHLPANDTNTDWVAILGIMGGIVESILGGKVGGAIRYGVNGHSREDALASAECGTTRT
jgi:hypothetical protein